MLKIKQFNSISKTLLTIATCYCNLRIFCILYVIIILYLPIKSSKISLKFSEMIGDL